MSARETLLKVQWQREELAAEERKLPENAVAGLGQVLIECCAETLEPTQLRRLIRSAMTLGI